jgi:hypothetical protein
MEVLRARPAAKPVFKQQIHQEHSCAESFGSTFSAKGVKKIWFFGKEHLVFLARKFKTVILNTLVKRQSKRCEVRIGWSA